MESPHGSSSKILRYDTGSGSKKRALRKDAFLLNAKAPHFELSSLWIKGLSSIGETKIASVDCQNGVMAVLLEDGVLVAHNLTQDKAIFSVIVKNPYKVFVNTTGSFIMVTSLDGEIYLFDVKHTHATAHVPLSTTTQEGTSSSLTGSHALCVGESVCWCSEKNDSTEGTDESSETHYSLVGSRKDGILVEVFFKSNPPRNLNLYCGRSLQLPHFFPLLAPVASVVVIPSETECLVWASSSTQLFRSSVKKLSTTTNALSSPVEAFSALSMGLSTFDVLQIPHRASMDPRTGSLLIFRPDTKSRANSFVWTSAGGVVQGLFQRPADNEDLFTPTAPFEVQKKCRAYGCMHEEMISTEEVIRAGRQPYSGMAIDAMNVSFPCESLLLAVPTAFHMVFLYSHRCLVVNHPPGLPWRGHSSAVPVSRPMEWAELAARVRFDPFCEVKQMEPLRGVIRDLGKRKLYIFSEYRLWELHFEEEYQQQSYVFLDRALRPDLAASLRHRLFSAAYKVSFDALQRDIVLFLHGHFIYQLGRCEKNEDVATTLWAKCRLVEKVYNFLHKQQQKQVLHSYISKRCEFLVNLTMQTNLSTSQRKDLLAQIGCFVLLGLQHKLSRAEPNEAGESVEQDVNLFLQDTIHKCPQLYQRDDFYRTVMQLLEEQGRVENALELATLTDHPQYVISHYVNDKKYREAIETLTKCTAFGKHDVMELWYEYAPVLIQHYPIALADGILRVCAKEIQALRAPPLQMERLLPAFVRYTSPQMNEDPLNTDHQVIVLLEQCISHFHFTSQTIHHYYLWLLCEQQQTERLRAFLEGTQVCEPVYAIRCCLQHQCFQACLILYKRLHLYEDAIRIALETSAPAHPDEDWAALNTVKEMLRALHHEVDAETQKRLWRLTVWLTEKKCGSRTLLALVDGSNGILRLEDVLDVVSDQYVLRDFKEPICRELTQYLVDIKAINQEQEKAYHTIEVLKHELRELQCRYGYVTPKQRCCLCEKNLLMNSEPYLIYPSCQHAVHESCAVKRLQDLGGAEAFLADQGVASHVIECVSSMTAMAQADCVICGEAAIIEIDVPICEHDDSWVL